MKLFLIFAAALCCMFVNSADIDGMVGAWDFNDAGDGRGRDYSEFGNHGELRSLDGPVADCVARLPGGTFAIAGNGSGRFFRVPDHTAYRNSNEFTIEIICTPEAYATGNNANASALFAFESTRARLWLSSNGVSMDSSPQDNHYQSAPHIKVPLGEKLHIFAFIGGGEIGVVVNGQKAVAPYRGTLRTSPGEINIGGHPYRGNRFFKGTIERVVLYDRRLPDQAMLNPPPVPFRPSAKRKSGNYQPGEKVEFVSMAGVAAPGRVSEDNGTFRWTGAGEEIHRTVGFIAAGDRPRELERIVRDQDVPAPAKARLASLLQEGEYEQFDRSLQEMDSLRNFFRDSARLHRMAKREIDEQLLFGHGTKPLPPICMGLPQDYSPEIFDSIYKELKNLYARLFWIPSFQDHPRVDETALERVLKDGCKASTPLVPPVSRKTRNEWNRRHPELSVAGYWFATAKAAEDGKPCRISLIRPLPDYRYDIQKYWQVRDETEGRDLEAGEWSPERGGRDAILVKHARKDHLYSVCYLSHLAGSESNSSHAAFPNQEQTELYVNDFKEFANRYANRISSIHANGIYRYPGWVQQNWWEFFSYAFCNANPEIQKIFEQETGIRFRPRMLFDSFEQPALDVSPSPERLAWMRFNQKNFRDYMTRLAEVCRENGIEYEMYWGDEQCGFEPDLEGLTATGIQGIARPLQDSVDVRSIMGVTDNGKVRKGFRLDWIFTDMINRPETITRLLNTWQINKRGLLFQVPDKLYWGELPPIFVYADPVRCDLLKRMIRRVNEEYLLMYKYLNGEKVFTHDLNVCIVNGWGKIYSWRPWKDTFLRHLTDVPVNIRFISFAEIADGGVPPDTHVLLIYGNSGSVWAGAAEWKSEALRQKIAEFVRNGGGMVGAGTPAFYENHNSLAEVFGFDYGGNASTNKLTAAPAWNKTFPGTRLPGAISTLPFAAKRDLVPNADFVLLASADGQGARQPVIGEHSYGKGRAVYIGFNSPDAAYSDLLKRTIFRAAGRERELSRLYSVNPAVIPYFYPSRGILICHNDSTAAQKTTLKFDLSLFRKNTGKAVLWNLLDDCSAGEYSAKELAAGIEIAVNPASTEYFILK